MSNKENAMPIITPETHLENLSIDELFVLVRRNSVIILAKDDFVIKTLSYKRPNHWLYYISSASAENRIPLTDSEAKRLIMFHREYIISQLI